jgi:hypothetical protein
MLQFAQSTFKSAYNRSFYGTALHILQRYWYDTMADISGEENRIYATLSWTRYQFIWQGNYRFYFYEWGDFSATVEIKNAIRKRCKLKYNMIYIIHSLLSKNLKIRIYRTIIFPVVLYGCETWLPTFRKEHRLFGFQNRVQRGVFGPKKDELTA